MKNRVIPIARGADLPAAAQQPAVPAGILADRFARPLRDLRISVTDRCNFRCTYCMPKDVFTNQYPFLRQDDLLSFQEIVRLTRLFAAHGVRKVRLTGGEPLLRKNLEQLVGMLGAVKTLDGDAEGFDLRTPVRNGCADPELFATLARLWHARSDRYSELRGATGPGAERSSRRVEMSYIGG